MSKKLFLLKIKNIDDRYTVCYLEKNILEFACGHYFSGVNLQGGCFSSDLKRIQDIDFENFTTILSKKDFEDLCDIDKEVKSLGFCIEKGDERYLKGLELQKRARAIIDKLESEENLKLQDEVIEQEKEYLKEKWDLDDEDIEDIFNVYYLDYKDRGCISYIYDDTYSVGYEMAWSCGEIDVDSYLARYFDFEEYGNDLINEGSYCKLKDGRVVSLNY